MEDLSLLPSEKTWLGYNCDFLKVSYLRYLQNYRYNPLEINILQNGGKLSLSVEGPWHKAILWEVPLMAMISELFFEMTTEDYESHNYDFRRKTNIAKVEILKENGIPFMEFGTRRRYSYKNQDDVLADICSVKDHTMIGTSNVALAIKHNLKPLGTMAHEWAMFHGAYGYKYANYDMMKIWRGFYGDHLSIALPDTYTTDNFLYAFNHNLVRAYDGVRHDSGDPLKFANKIVEHYLDLGIDPSTKTIVFSDSLDVGKILYIHEYCKHLKIKDVYGVGTSLSNDVGVRPLNMVIKMSDCRLSPNHTWRPTVKLSDDEGKHTGDPDEIEFCKEQIK
jgi:nicotinate phosphoribosyltransferase